MVLTWKTEVVCIVFIPCENIPVHSTYHSGGKWFAPWQQNMDGSGLEVSATNIGAMNPCGYW